MAADSEATGNSRGRSPGQSLALYRKYRPATFAEVRGQEHVTDPLRQALRSGRINHAYLFSGPRGCGKTSSARILARSLNCVNGPTPDPCGVCDSCVALAPSGPGSIDVIEIDAASHGGVDDARDLRERAFYAPVAGRYKIYIIDEAHMVTQQGFNALLKLVEEPPPHLKFIFATTEPEKVIPTIRSRTHHYPFRLMPPSVMRELTEQILKSEQVPFDPVVLPLVVRAGGGSARDTLSILDQLVAGSDESGIKYDRAVALLGFTDASLLDEMVDAFASGNGAAVFGAVNRVIEGGHEPRRFATDLLDRFRDLIVLASVPDAIDTGLIDAPPDRAEALREQAGRYGLASLTRAADLVAAGLDQMRGATSPRLLLELMCAQVLLPAAATDERSLLARLERLEAGAAAAPAPGYRTHDAAERERHTPAPPAIPGGGAAPSGVQPPAAQPAAAGTAAGPAAAPAVPSPGQQGDQSRDAGQHAGHNARPQHAGPQHAGPQHAGPQAPQPASQPPPASVPPPAPAPASAPPSRPAPAFTHAPGAPGAPDAPGSQAAAPPPGAPRGSVTVDTLRQAWPGVVEAIKAKGRVAWMVISNASVASFDEGVLTLRFPRQGDVKGFQGGKYEEPLKVVLNSMFGINVVIRAVTGGGDAPSPSRRPASPGPGSGPAPAPGGQPSSSPFSPSGQSSPPPSAPPSAPPPERPPQAAGPAAPGAGPAGHGAPQAGGVNGAPFAPAPPGGAGNGTGESTPSFPVPASSGDDLPPLPPPPAPDDDEDFDADDEVMSSSTTVDELTGMALVQRELGAQIIAEYED